MKREFLKVANDFGDMEPFSELVTELENAIGNYSSTVRSIKSGEYSVKCTQIQMHVGVNMQQSIHHNVYVICYLSSLVPSISDYKHS